MLVIFLSFLSLADLSDGLVGYEFQDNKSKDRFTQENGEMNTKLPAVPDYVAVCFSLYVKFNRYSNIIPLIDFRTSHDQKTPFVRIWGKDEMINFYLRSTWPFSESSTNNGRQSIQLKWLAFCFNFNFVNGTTDLFMNGKRLKQNVRNPFSRGDHEGKPLIIRMGSYYYDRTPLIGKLVDINIWDRLLNEQELNFFTNCTTYVPTTAGNLVNENTRWNISGTLIKKVDLSEDEVFCSPRTIFVHVKYKTRRQAMAVCEELGETGSFLAQFKTFADWKLFYSKGRKNAAVKLFCFHGARLYHWLPYDRYDAGGGLFRVKHYGTGEPLAITEQWSSKYKNNNKNNSLCVAASLGKSANSSWFATQCDKTEDDWDLVPCTACTIPNNVNKSIVFVFRGFCDRSEFDTKYTLLNDETTGIISYIGKKHTVIQYNQELYKWEIRNENNPKISASSYADISTFAIGTNKWEISGDFACNTKDQTLDLTLSSCSGSEFTCSDGVCIDINKRCDNINDCRDKSDEANCKRVKMKATYQKFIVPPPALGNGENKINVGISVDIDSIMEINEVDGIFQVQFYLLMKWFDSRLDFLNLKTDITLNTFLPSEKEDIWVPELVFYNTEERPSSIVDETASIKVNKESDFEPAGIDENENIQYFKGSENPVLLRRFYNSRFLCDYKMEWYPFDVQRCTLVLAMKPSFEPFAQLVVEKLQFIGEQNLAKYTIKNFTMDVIELEESSAIELEIILGRQILSEVMNTFVPTILLNLISHSTNFYKDAFFETVIAINLTSMLVLVALFVSVNEGLPQTSYLKAIDVWLLFNLLVPFVEIIIHTYMDTQRGEEDDKKKEFLTHPDNVAVMQDKRKRNLKICHFIAHRIIPFVAIVFVLIFWFLGLAHSYTDT